MTPWHIISMRSMTMKDGEIFLKAILDLGNVYFIHLV